MLGHVLSTANTVRKMATGEASAATDEQHKLTDFLTTLVTYPALYIFATASTAEPSPGDGAPEVPPQGAKGRRNAATSAVASATKRAVPPGLTGLAGGGVSGVGSGEELGSGPVMALAPEPRHRLSDFPEGRALVALERWCREPVFLGLGGELWARTREYGRGFIASGMAPHWLVSSLAPWLESFPDAAPSLPLEGVVEAAVREAREGARAEEDSVAAGAGPTLEGGPAAVGWEGGLPLRRLAAAASPNLAHISRTLQQRYRLSRGRTWLEFTQIFLGIFRSWLRLVASCFSLAAMVLRLLGTGTTVLSGAVAFTVVLSIGLSILSALLTVAATAADAIASLLRTLANATESVYSRSRGSSVRQQLEGDMVGPRFLEAASFEELEDLFISQLAPRLRLRSRPDAARLAGDPLLLRAYDLRLVDAAGGVVADEPAAVEARFEGGGFFGLASAAMRKAGAVLFLRLLAWKRVGLCCASPEALKYVFVLGARGAGRATAFAALAHLPVDYQVPSSVPAEIRPIQRLPGAYAVLASGMDSTDPRVAAKASHFANLEHGVFSVLVYVVSVESDPAPELLGSPVWQSLAAHKPTLLLISKGTKLTEQLMDEPRAVEQLKSSWQAVLHEGAARRGLEADMAAVLVAEMRDAAPPAGVAGPQQVRDWLAAALEGATTR